MSPVVDSIYTNNLIDGSTITDCSIITSALHVDINAGSTTWQHIYGFMTYWLSTVVGIADQYLEMTATDQTHYVFATAHGAFKIKNVTSGPSVPLEIDGGNAKPDTGAATSILDTSGGMIFCNSAEVVPFNSSSQAVNSATVIAAINSTIPFVGGRVDANIGSVNGVKVNGNGSNSTPWGP